MSDRSTDPEPGPAHEPEPAGDPQPKADRRSFLRQLSTDAVWTAGKVAGASAALRRGLVAAGGSAIETFEGATETEAMATEPVVTGPPPVSQPAVAPDVPVSERPTLTTRPDPVATLTPDQHAFLVRGARAALAVNDPGGHPLLAPSFYHWDGAVIRLPARDNSARTVDIDRDPKVALLIYAPASEAWVAINGVASLVYGEHVEPEMRLILSKYHEPDAVTARWEHMRATGDQLAIRIRPTRFVWGS